MRDPPPPAHGGDPQDAGSAASLWDSVDRADGADLARLLTRPDLPATFERWRMVLAPGAEQPTTAEEWAGALVLVERGHLEVDCHAGGRHTFAAGDLLVLGWLPLQTLRNRGEVPVRLVAVRRRGNRPPEGGCGAPASGSTASGSPASRSPAAPIQTARPADERLQVSRGGRPNRGNSRAVSRNALRPAMRPSRTSRTCSAHGS